MEEHQLLDSLPLKEGLSFYCQTADFIATSVIPEWWKPTNQSCRNWSGKASSDKTLDWPSYLSCCTFMPPSQKPWQQHLTQFLCGEGRKPKQSPPVAHGLAHSSHLAGATIIPIPSLFLPGFKVELEEEQSSLNTFNNSSTSLKWFSCRSPVKQLKQLV